MKFNIYDKIDNTQTTREFKSLEDLMTTIRTEWIWAKVQICGEFGNEIILTYDETQNDTAWND